MSTKSTKDGERSAKSARTDANKARRVATHLRHVQKKQAKLAARLELRAAEKRAARHRRFQRDLDNAQHKAAERANEIRWAKRMKQADSGDQQTQQ